MNPVARRILFSLAVLVWSATLLYFHATGRLQNYLAPNFRMITFYGGLGLAVLGLFNLLTAARPATGGCQHDGGCDHDAESSDLHPLVALVLMVVPLVFAVIWTKDCYSPQTLARKGLYDAPTPGGSSFLALAMPSVSREQILNTQPKNSQGYFRFNLMELFFSTGDRAMQSAIEGLKIETEGRWISEKNHPSGSTRMRLYRLYMTCCAADSRTIPISLEFGSSPPDFPENQWTRVSGTLRFPSEDGIVHPVLDVEHAIASPPPPEESFLRP